MDDNSSDIKSNEAAGARVQAAASKLAQEGKTMAGRAIADGADKIERTAHSTSGALRRAAEDVRAENTWVGALLQHSADAIDRTADAARGGDPARIADMLHDLARRQPALFIGASAALGFAVSRLGKTALEQNGNADASLQPKDYQSVDVV